MSDNVISVMTPAQITRGLAFRRYAFAKPVQQIADETQLRYDQVLGVLKGEPMNIAVAARLTGYLRTPCATSQKWRDRTDDGMMRETRKKLFRRLARMRCLARHLNLHVGFRSEGKLVGFTDGELRAFTYNVEDIVKEEILRLYPTVAELFKFSDDLAPWEYLEHIDAIKGSPQARHAIRRHQDTLQAQNSGEARRTG